MKINLGIIEDDIALREGFVKYLSLQPDIECNIVAGSVEEFVDLTDQNTQIDVLLSDIGLPGKSGIEGIAFVREHFPDCNILMFTVYNDSERVFQALCAGAVGYILKNTSLSKIAESIRDVHKGDAAMSPSIARKVIAHFQTPAKEKKAQLTKREYQIVEGIVDGLSYKMIGERLGITFETAKQHIKNIYRKLEINSKAELIAKSFKGEL